MCDKKEINTPEPLLKVEHLTKHFPVKKKKFLGEKQFVHAVDDASFEIYPGETLGVVGESGSGKSTLARVILGLTSVTGGTVHYKGKDVTGFSVPAAEKRRLRSELQMVFQDPYASLNPKMKIGDAIVEPMLASGKVKSKREAKKRVCELLERVGLRAEVYDRYPHEFSGGQRQRVGIVRALAVGPELLICDESVSALDVSVQAQILNLFNELKKDFNLTYMFIGHDLAVIRYISDRILVMYLGQIMEIAPYDKIFGDNTHPYTQALVSAIPEPTTAPRTQRILLTGDIPSGVNPPDGCRFCQRCMKAQDICFNQNPKLVEVEEGHLVRCHFAKEVNVCSDT